MKKLSRSFFVVFCGPEGGGKSTQIKLLHTWLTDEGYDVEIASEQRASVVGKLIRSLTKLDLADGVVELFLFCAARRHNNVRYIQPALHKGKIVLLDRYIPDSYAYQCVARGAVDSGSFKFIMDWTKAGVPTPDLCVWMDLDPSLGLKRKMRQRKLDRFESEDISFHRSVARGFDEFFKTWPEYAHVRINASDGVQIIHKRIKERVSALLSPWKVPEDPA